MKLKSRSILEFSIEIDENHSILYDSLKIFFRQNTFKYFDADNTYVLFHSYINICVEVLKYFISNDMIVKVSNSILQYQILDSEFVPKIYELELFFNDIEKNIKAHKREHIIESIIINV
tara:strand:+ start:230 stop:586 length:357 start_codon:yes stop_codon:yes gene_type:complete